MSPIFPNTASDNSATRIPCWLTNANLSRAGDTQATLAFYFSDRIAKLKPLPDLYALVVFINARRNKCQIPCGERAPKCRGRDVFHGRRNRRRALFITAKYPYRRSDLRQATFTIRHNASGEIVAFVGHRAGRQ